MNIDTILQVVGIHKTAETINGHWEAREQVDWSEAEELVSLLEALPEEIKTNNLDIAGILEYVAQYDDWDSGDVANWPATVISFSERCDKAYTYRQVNDNWEVYSLDGTGAQEWKATTETESIAQHLAQVLQMTINDNMYRESSTCNL